jgi:hypothetical protein
MSRSITFALGAPLGAAAILALGNLHWAYAALGQQAAAPGAVEAQVVGRLIVDSSGSAQLIGYFPYISGLPSNLFLGTASETTAYFTFRSSTFNLAFLQNGNILHLLSTPSVGTTNLMSVYFNSNPYQTFQTPDTFSNGELIAQYNTVKFMGTATPYSGAEAGTLMLVSSHSFSFQGETYNVGPLGSAMTISLTFGQPISGRFTMAPAAMAFGGYAIGVENTSAAIERRAP